MTAPLRIVIDARYTRIDRHDGISRFGASLIAAVSKIADVTMLVSDIRQLALLPAVPHLLVNSPFSLKEFFIARTLNQLEADVVMCPLQTMGSLGRKYALVLTLHDLIYYDYRRPPSMLPAPIRALWWIFHLAYWPQRFLLNRADVVVTVSRTTRSLMTRRRLTDRPIRIVSNAPHPQSEPRDPFADADKTLVYMGSFMPYKNVETIIDAMVELPDYTLHLLSPITRIRQAELEARVHDGTQVIFHDGVTDKHYFDLVSRATALVSLSRVEGYGLPLVEAMAVGTPVIVSDIPIFREICGTAASYVNSSSLKSFAAAVRRLDDTSHWRKMSRRSVVRAHEFDWDKSACELMIAAREAVTRRRG